jgi:hypothetical protein
VDAKGIAAFFTVAICLIGGIAFGTWMGSDAAGWFMACALLTLAD